MAEDGQGFSVRNDSAVATSSQLMIAAVIFLFLVVVFIFFLYLYAKHNMGSHPALRRGSNRFLFAASDVILPLPRRGLDAEILDSIPVKPFKASDFQEGLECSVCLSEVYDGEAVRLLPKCGHGFHVACIDMWFASHSTCPLCRAAVEPLTVSAGPTAAEATGFPTNVLFWGSEHRASAAGRSDNLRPRGPLVIDIPPRTAAEGFVAADETKTPKLGRLKSLRRLLSRGKMVVGSSCTPRGGGDIEQGAVCGEGSSLAPKTPTPTHWGLVRIWFRH